MDSQIRPENYSEVHSIKLKMRKSLASDMEKKDKMVKVQSSRDRLSDIWLKEGVEGGERTSMYKPRKMTTEIGTEKLMKIPAC